MSIEDDLRILRAQEAALVFPSFDEATAFAIGAAIRDGALAHSLPIIVDIRLWDRQLFYAALPGSTATNANWARRKRNVVRLLHRSSYRLVLEKNLPDRTFPASEGLDPADYVLAGGGFPINVVGVGVIGAIAVSGLPERQDHEIIIAALCAHLGLDHAAFALPAST